MGRPRAFSNEQILAATREAIAEHGPGVPTATIAERLGMSQAALFKRFGTKEELLIAALRPEPPAWIPELEKGPDERPIPDQLREVAEELSLFFADLMPRMMALHALKINPMQIMASYEKPPPLVSFEAVTSWFRQAQDAGRIAGADPTTIATSLLGSLNAAEFYKHMGATGLPYDDREAYLDELVALLWRAIKPAED